MKVKIVVGVLIIVAALIYLLISSYSDNALYYMTVKELGARGTIPAHEGLRINGTVAPSSIRWNADKIELRFKLAEGEDTLRVLYRGVAPDQLAEAQQVVVEGKLAAKGELVATKILLKCPSKYEVKKQ